MVRLKLDKNLTDLVGSWMVRFTQIILAYIMEAGLVMAHCMALIPYSDLYFPYVVDVKDQIKINHCTAASDGLQMPQLSTSLTISAIVFVLYNLISNC